MAEDNHSSMLKHSTGFLPTSVEKARVTEDTRQAKALDVRRMNPTGRDGQVMKRRVCNSPEHFEARCPQPRNTSTSPQLFVQTVAGPLTNILNHTNHGVTSYPIFSTNPVPVVEEPQEERTLSFMVRDRTSNDPVWQQESDPWQGTSRAVPKPPLQEHPRLAPKAKAAPEQERSPWTNWAAHAQETSAESSDTSRVAQASEPGSPVNPQQPPRLWARQRITSDRGRLLRETYRDSPSPPRNSNSALPTDRPRLHINPDISSIFNNRTEDINHGVNTVHGSDSAFMRAARSSSVEVPPTAGIIAATAVQQSPSLVEPPRMTDNIIQQLIAGHNMANEMRAQHRQQIRNGRAGGTRTPSQIPTAFQQMTALSQGRPMEPPSQAPVHNLDPLGLFPNFSLFAGSIMVPQQTEVTATSTQQIEVPASRPPVETTPVPDTNRTRTPPADEVPVIFDGDNRTCTICQEELEDGERVV